MRLTKKQVKAYISLFEDEGWRYMLEAHLKIKGNKWYLRKLNKKHREETGEFAYLYNTIGYDDEIDIYWYETILKGANRNETNI